MVTRVQMLLDELLATEDESKGVGRDKPGTGTSPHLWPHLLCLIINPLHPRPLAFLYQTYGLVMRYNTDL